MKILTGGQFRELDRYTIEHEPIASIDLMERASRAVAAEIERRYAAPKEVFVFAGPGGNGGDGLAVARLLTEKGYHVTAYLFNVKGTLSEDCDTNRKRLQETPGAVLVEVTAEFVFPELRPGDLVIDALFGTGLSKPLSGGFALVAKKLNQTQATVVSIDVPSGLMCEDNAFNDKSSIIRAELTLSIQLPKLAFLFAENQRYVGEFCLLDIGLSNEGLSALKTPYWITEHAEMKAMLRQRPRFAHKGTMGHALMVCGSRGMAGAAILSAQAALRTGLGKLTVHTPHANLNILQSSVPEAVVQMDIDADVITAAIDASGFQAIGIGPGLGLSRHTALALQAYIHQQACPMVIDADGLNLLAQDRQWIDALPPDSILTPHPREFDNLFGHSANSFERLKRARNAAINHHLFILIKGHYSAICTPTGDVIFNPTGNPGMATPGSGDVLTGIITSLLAQGYLPAEAIQLGVYLHGLAGDAAAEELGEECMLASDIISHLPAAFRRLRVES